MKPDPLTGNDQLVAAIIARHGNVVVDLLNYVNQADASPPSLFKKKSSPCSILIKYTPRHAQSHPLNGPQQQRGNQGGSFQSSKTSNEPRQADRYSPIYESESLS